MNGDKTLNFHWMCGTDTSKICSQNSWKSVHEGNFDCKTLWWNSHLKFHHGWNHRARKSIET